MENKKPSIDKIIAQQKACLENAERHKQLLIDYIREFVDAKRGNQAWLSEQSGVQGIRISNMLNGTGNPPSLEKIVLLADLIQKYLN